MLLWLRMLCCSTACWHDHLMSGYMWNSSTLTSVLHTPISTVYGISISGTDAVSLLLRPSRGLEYCDQPVCLCVCLSTSISLEWLDRSAQNFVCRSPFAMARSSSVGVALHYVLLVLWMTSSLAGMGARPARVGSTQRWRSITCMTRVESDVHEWLLEMWWNSDSYQTLCYVLIKLIAYSSSYVGNYCVLGWWAHSLLLPLCYRSI